MTCASTLDRQFYCWGDRRVLDGVNEAWRVPTSPVLPSFDGGGLDVFDARRIAGRILPEDHRLQFGVEVLQRGLVIARHGLHRHARRDAGGRP